MDMRKMVDVFSEMKIQIPETRTVLKHVSGN